MRGHAIPYSAEELAFVKENCALPRRQLFALFQARFARDGVSLQALKALCKRKGWFTGRDGRFPPGVTPANKGKPMPYHPNSAAHRFKRGGRTGRAAENYQPIGAERVSKDGYRERKVHDGMPMQSRWQTVQRINWEAANGPMPQGMALKCLDGDRGNTDPSNWELVERALLPRLNGRFGRGYDTAPAELKPTIMAVAKLEHRARQRSAR